MRYSLRVVLLEMAGAHWYGGGMAAKLAMAIAWVEHTATEHRAPFTMTVCFSPHSLSLSHNKKGQWRMTILPAMPIRRSSCMRRTAGRVAATKAIMRTPPTHAAHACRGTGRAH